MIKAIVFDYFGVIATDAYWNDAHEIAMLNGDEPKLNNLVLKMDMGELSWKQFCESTATLLGVSASDVHKKAQEIQANKQLIIYINQLKDSGYKIGLLSNASSEYLVPLIEKAHIGHLFDEVVVSSDVGVSKPNPKIYKEILQRLGVEPSEAIYIDDMPINVAGAEAVGMRGVHFVETAQTTNDIQRILANTND